MEKSSDLSKELVTQTHLLEALAEKPFLFDDPEDQKELNRIARNLKSKDLNFNAVLAELMPTILQLSGKTDLLEALSYIHENPELREAMNKKLRG